MRDHGEREAVITGAAVCCNLGDDLEEIGAHLRAGRPVTFTRWAFPLQYEARSNFVALHTGELVGDKHATRLMGRAARLAYHAAVDAVAHAGLSRSDCAVVVGSGTGDMSTMLTVYDKLKASGTTRRVSPLAAPLMMASNVSASLSTALHLTGPSFSPSAACATGALSIALAAQLIETGMIDCAIAGGAEAADPLFHAAFDAARAYHDGSDDNPARVSRPYAADRSGFVFGEGAGIVILEAREVALARGARMLGSVAGYGITSNGTRDMVGSDINGALQAMRQALARAHLRPEDVGYINTHATSTQAGDLVEVEAVRALMGGEHIRYSSTKGYTGHTISAAGAIEVVFTCLMLQNGWVAPSLNAEPLDPALVMYPPVMKPTDADFEFALSNSLGFGGTNVCVALRR